MADILQLPKKREPALCRWCRRILRGEAYMYGGRAYHPTTGEQCKVNYYGGFICSPGCDFKASLELEQSMPGHTYTQRDLSGSAREAYKRNWREA